MFNLYQQLSLEFKIDAIFVQNAINLLFSEKCTIPFVTRYRKEKTGSMDEVRLRKLRDRFQYLSDLEATKERYLRVIKEHAEVKSDVKKRLPEIEVKLASATTKQEVDDIYLPFKAKRKTRASLAKDNGLEALLDKIIGNWKAITNLEDYAKEFLSENLSVEKKVPNAEEALKGASDILAERLNESSELRKIVRAISFDTGVLVAKKVLNKNITNEEINSSQKKSKYQSYFDYREPIKQAPSHRVMAVRRGEVEKELRVSIEVEEERIRGELYSTFVKSIVSEGESFVSPSLEPWIRSCITDTYKRLLSPSIEAEIRLKIRSRAEDEALLVFNANLKNLLLMPPLKKRCVLGVDPGLRTGSKLAVVSPCGDLLGKGTIFLSLSSTSETKKSVEAEKIILDLIQIHKVECIALGNGTGSRETDTFITDLLKKSGLEHIKRYLVNESGASVYSTDEIAREEFPDLDPTIRSAVSIARRLQDPLAELIKIDPKALGIGQYQHDCDASKLDNSLKETVESCVNRVGVNVNTASYKLLSYVSGIGPSLAMKIVERRKQLGPYKSRQEFEGIPGFGKRAFEQAAGFLRILGGDNLLDSSAVHPESYGIIEKFSSNCQIALSELIGKYEVIKTIPLEKYVTDTVGMPTLLDIVRELSKPGRDPRGAQRQVMSNSITSLKDLKQGMRLCGTVSNVTNFGCFVDIGVHQDGLVHISEYRLKPGAALTSIVSMGSQVNVFVKDIDIERRRISLSLSSNSPSQQQSIRNGRFDNKYQNRTLSRQITGKGPNSNGNGNVTNQGAGNYRPSRGPSHRGRSFSSRGGRSTTYRNKAPDKSYSVDDLLNKFNTK